MKTIKIAILLLLFSNSIFSQRVKNINDSKENSDWTEVHIDNVFGEDSYDVSGSNVSPFRTYEFYKTLLITNNGNPFYGKGNVGVKICFDNLSTENYFEITQNNATLTAHHSTRDGLTRCKRIRCNSAYRITLTGITVDTLEILNTGTVYLENCSVKSIFTKSGSGYFETKADCDFQTANATISGTGQCVFVGGLTPAYTSITNANAAVTMRNVTSGGSVNLGSGTLILDGGYMFPLSSGTSVITSSFGTVVKLENMNLVEVSGLLAKISIGGAISYSNVKFDKANTTFLGTNLNNPTWFDNIGLMGSIPTYSAATECLVINQNGTLAKKTLSTGGGGTTLPTTPNGYLYNTNGTYAFKSIVSADLPQVIAAGTTGNIGYNSNGNITSITPLNSSHIPNLDFSKITTGIVPKEQGGTGRSTIGASNTLLYSDGTALQYLSAPTATDQVLTSTLSGSMIWAAPATSGGVSSVDINNLYVSYSGSDVTGNGSMLKPYKSLDTAIKYGTKNIILMPSENSYGSFYVDDKPISGLLPQVNSPANSCIVSQITFVNGGAGNNFNCRSVSANTVYFGGIYGGCYLQDMNLYPNTNSSAVTIRGDLLATTPSSEYKFVNVDFNLSNTLSRAIMLYPAAYPSVLYLDNCKNARIYCNVSSVITADSIPANWTVKYVNCTPIKPKNATSLNFINNLIQNNLATDLATGTVINTANNLVKLGANGKIPKSTQNSIAQPWVLSTAYDSLEVVIYSNTLYKANAPIPANTTFKEGISGATWKTIAETGKDKIIDMVSGFNCTLFLTLSGEVYGAKSNSATAGMHPGIGENNFSFTHNTGFGLERMRKLTFYNPFTNDFETGKCKKIAIQGTIGYALFENGNLYTWGGNASGGCGLGTSTTPYFVDQYRPVWSNNNVVDVYTHPSGNCRNVPSQVRSIIKKTDGYLYGCGFNQEGALGLNNTTNYSYWVQLTWAGQNPLSVWNLGSSAGCLIIQKSDYSIWLAGHNSSGHLGTGFTGNVIQAANLTANWMVGGATNQIIKKISGGFGYYDSNGNVYGNNSFLIMWLNDNANTADIIRVCGDDTWGSLGNGATGSINIPASITIPGTGRITQLFSNGGWWGKVSLIKNGKLNSWGYNLQGAIGDASYINITSPTTIKSSLTFTEMYGDDFVNFGTEYLGSNTFARDNTGKFFYCGRNTFGQSAAGYTSTNINELLYCHNLSSKIKVKKIDYHGTSGDWWVVNILSENGDILVYGYNGRGYIEPENQGATNCLGVRIIKPNLSLDY